MVSDDPIITEAILPAIESGPTADKMSCKMAREPLPDTGLSRARGRTSGGIPKAFVTGARTLAKKDRAPEARSILTLATRPTKAESTEHFLPPLWHRLKRHQKDSPGGKSQTG